MKMTFDDELQALLLLRSLPDSWEILMVSLSNSAPNGVGTMSQLTGSLLNKETRRKLLGSSSHSEALVTERRGRSKSQKPSKYDRSRGRSKSENQILRKEIECYNYHKKGYIKRECRKFKKEQEKEKDNKEDKSTVTVITDGEVIIVYDDNFIGLACDNTSWLVDSGASLHVTPRADFFIILHI